MSQASDLPPPEEPKFGQAKSYQLPEKKRINQLPRSASTMSNASTMSLASLGLGHQHERDADAARQRRARSVAAKEEAQKLANEKNKQEAEKRQLRRMRSKRNQEKIRHFDNKRKKKKKGLPKNLRVGDAVLVKQGLGIVKYIGPVKGSKKKRKKKKGAKPAQGSGSPKKGPVKRSGTGLGSSAKLPEVTESKEVEEEGEETFSMADPKKQAEAEEKAKEAKEKEPEVVYAGVELKDAKGKNNGVAFGVRYFRTDGKRGIFTKHIRKVLQPENILHMLAKQHSKIKQENLRFREMFEEAVETEVDKMMAELQAENDALVIKLAEMETERIRTERESVKAAPDNDNKEIDVPMPPSPREEDSGLSGQGYDDADSTGGTPLSMKNIDPKLAVHALIGPGSLAPGKVSSFRESLGLPPRSSMRSGKKVRALFREKSENFWEETNQDQLKNDLMAQIEAMQKETKDRALSQLDLPDFNAPDRDFTAWLKNSLTRFVSQDRSFVMPDMENPAVTRALVTVARMLARVTQSHHADINSPALEEGSDEDFSDSSSYEEDGDENDDNF